MWLAIRLAWRNLFRNKRRTFISGTAIGIGLASLVFADALMLGMKETMVQNLTASYLGEGQIHAAGYRETSEVEHTIRHLPAVVKKLGRDPRVLHFSQRAQSLGMVSSAADYRSILLVGIEPEAERGVSQVDDAIIQGTFFDGDEPRDIVLGEKLAEDLEVALGDRIVVTSAVAETGELAQELFLVSGIYRFNSKEMDSGMAFVRLAKAQQMLGISSGAHEIAMVFADPELVRNANHLFWKEYSEGGNEALGWPALMPQIEAMFELSDIGLYVIGAILFGVVAFGIINTLFMSIYERIFEFGILKAVGTRSFRVGQLIVLEAAALAIVSSLAGILLGFAVTWIFSRTGIDYRGIEFLGQTIRNLIYPVLRVRQFVIYPFWVLVFVLLTSLYPAWYAARIKPAEAMRRSL